MSGRRNLPVRRDFDIFAASLRPFRSYPYMVGRRRRRTSYHGCMWDYFDINMLSLGLLCAQK